jgi:hypothetical protein
LYDALLSPQGLVRGGALDAQGARAVLNLRAKYAGSAQGLGDLGSYIDARYLVPK